LQYHATFFIAFFDEYMNPSIKELIKTQLETLKKMGKDRRTIERELGYSENYLDQILSKGGNDTVLQALIDYRERFELGEDEPPYKKLNIATSQQDTIERITRMLEKEQTKNHELQDRVFELQNKLIEMGQSKGNRRSA